MSISKNSTDIGLWFTQEKVFWNYWTPLYLYGKGISQSVCCWTCKDALMQTALKFVFFPKSFFLGRSNYIY